MTAFKKIMTSQYTGQNHLYYKNTFSRGKHLRNFSQGVAAVILLLQPIKLSNPRILRLNRHPWDKQVAASQLSQCRNCGTKLSTDTRLEMSEASAQCCNCWTAHFIAQNRSDMHQFFPHWLLFSFSPVSCHCWLRVETEVLELLHTLYPQI